MIDIQFSSRRRSGKPPTVAGKLFVSLFFLIFLAAGVVVAWLLGRQLVKSLGTRGWPTVPCTIVSGKIEDKSPYKAAVIYNYQINGRDLKGRAISAGYAGSDDYYDAQKILEQYPAGTRATCRVNPADPTDAVLQTPSLWTVLQILFPMVFIAIGAGGIYFIWRVPNPFSPRVPRKNAKAPPAIILVGFFIVGVVLTGFLVPMLIRYRSAQNWPKVPCDILHSSVKTESGDHGDTYGVEVLFRYHFNNRSYESSRYTLVRSSSSGYADKKKIVDQLNQNHRQFCYMNQLDPADAVLERDSSLVYIILGIAAAVTLLIGGGGLTALVRSAQRDHHTKLEEHLPGSRRGPRQLQASASPLAQFLGACLLPMFWNGLVSVFVVVIIQQWRNGEGELFPTIFIFVFVLIGLALLGHAISQVRTLFLPTAQIIVSRHPLAIGEQVELRWQILGHADRIKKLKIRVAIFDVSADPSGHLPLRKLIPSWSMDVIDTDKRGDIQSGRRMFSIPAGGLPPAGIWKRIWAILVEAEMEKPPQLRQEFPAHVLTMETKSG